MRSHAASSSASSSRCPPWCCSPPRDHRLAKGRCHARHREAAPGRFVPTCRPGRATAMRRRDEVWPRLQAAVLMPLATGRYPWSCEYVKLFARAARGRSHGKQDFNFPGEDRRRWGDRSRRIPADLSRGTPEAVPAPSRARSAQAFAVILSLMILTFGIAGIGVMAWLLGRTVGPKTPVPGPAMGTLAALIVLVLGAAVYVGAQAKPDSQSPGKVEAGPGGVAVGGNVEGSTINVGSSPGGENKSK
jgi:hypothetical protein